MKNSLHLYRVCFAIACLGTALACQKPEADTSSRPAADTPATAPAAAAEAAPSVAVNTAPPVDVDTLPAEEDFEEEVEAEITAANLEEQLDALEKEVAAD